MRSILNQLWYGSVAVVVACTTGWDVYGKANAATAGSVWLQPISAHGRARLALLKRHDAPMPMFYWNSRQGEDLQRNVLSVEVIIGDEDDNDQVKEGMNNTSNDDAQAKLSQLIEHLHAVAGSLRIPSSILARYTSRLKEELDSNNTLHPRGDRWAIAAKDVDLSGVWKPIISSEFKRSFNDYLVNCSLSYFHRKLLVNGISLQTEYIEQRYQGQELEILDKTPAGSWNRTLVTSGTTVQVDRYEARNITMKDPHGDFVQVESWWEGMGSVHKSWLRGKPNSYGSTIETSRYLEGDDTLVCESTFFPGPEAPASHRYAEVVFRFERIS